MTRVPARAELVLCVLSLIGNHMRVIIASAVMVLNALLLGLTIAERQRRRLAQNSLVERDAALRITNLRVRDLAGRLITAQEAERTRIARDLHDGACQEVAAVAVELSHLRHQRRAIQDRDVQEALAAVQHRTAAVAENLRLLSHELHPTVLQHLGLVAALEGHCADVERQHHVYIAFCAEGDVEPGSPVVALSLFRIAQEALRNASKHAHARRITVSLGRREDYLTLAVSDDGMGFELNAARQTGGLGLVSIEERARLAKGQATIWSQPQHGTAIEVRIPVPDDPGNASGGIRS